MLLSIDLLSFKLGRKAWHRFVSTFLMFYAQIVFTQFFLGLVHQLDTIQLLVVNAVISSLLLFYLLRKKPQQLLRRYGRQWASSLGAVHRDVRTDWLYIALLVVTGLISLWTIFLGLVFPVIDWDGNAYHMTYIGYVFQNHHIFDTFTNLAWIAGYPKGGEFIQMWNVLIPRNDILADLAQVPFAILGVYSLYYISTRLGVAAKHARFSSLAFLLLPIVINQMKTTYVDVLTSSLFIAGIALTLKSRYGRLDFLLLGIICSLLLSIKSSGLIFVAALVPLFLWKLWRQNKDESIAKLKTFAWQLGLVALPLIFGAYWYVKNLFLYGTPLYPFGIKVAGIQLFPGKTFEEFLGPVMDGFTQLPKGCLERVWFTWTEQERWSGCLYNYDSTFAGLGPVWFVILLPAAILGIALAIWKKNYLFLYISAVAAAVFALHPFNFYSRYTLFIALVGIIGFGLVLTHITSLARTVSKVSVILLALVVAFTNLTLCYFTVDAIRMQWRSLKDPALVGETFYAVNPGKAYIFMSRTAEPGDVVAYGNVYFIYPLWRADYKNSLVYTPADKDVHSWLESLRRSNATYVFTDKTSKEHAAAAEAQLKTIYEDDLYEVYKVE